MTQITVNTLEVISSSDLSSFISRDVAGDMTLFAKQLLYQKNQRKSFNNDKQYEVSPKHSSYPVTLMFRKTVMKNVKNENT